MLGHLPGYTYTPPGMTPLALPGATLGSGEVIAAGSVLDSSMPPAGADQWSAVIDQIQAKISDLVSGISTSGGVSSEPILTVGEHALAIPLQSTPYIHPCFGWREKRRCQCPRVTWFWVMAGAAALLLVANGRKERV